VIEGFQPADYALCGLTVVMAVAGLFRGFSGALGFLLAVVAAAATAVFGWMYSVSLTTVVWQRAAGVLLTTLLAFGIVRTVVKRLVNGLLAQPSDALFGLLTGAAFGVLALLVWTWSGLYPEYSFLVRECAAYVR